MHVTLFWCLILSWSQKRTRCAWSSRWRWTVKTATSSSFVARSPPSAFTLWTPPASAVATSWTWVKDTQVDEGYLLPHLLSYMLAPSHIFKCSQWANTHLHVLPVFLFLQSLFLSSCCFLCLYFEPLCLPGRLFLTFFLFMLLPPPPPPHLTSLPLRGLAQCASLTPTRPNQCPSPTSAHTNPFASTPDPTFTRLTLSLTLTLRMRKNVTGGWSRASAPWPSPTISPLRLNLQVTLHGGSKPGMGMKILLFPEFYWNYGEKKKASTLVQPCKCQLIPLLCWLCPCCALIPCNIHWTQEYSQLDPSLLSSDRFHCRGCGETFFLQEWSVCLSVCVCVLSFTKSLTLIAHFHLPYDAL